MICSMPSIIGSVEAVLFFLRISVPNFELLFVCVISQRFCECLIISRQQLPAYCRRSRNGKGVFQVNGVIKHLRLKLAVRGRFKDVLFVGKETLAATRRNT